MTGADAEPGPVGRVAVVGGGTMGAGITHVLLAAGLPVTLVEASPDDLARARQRVAASLDRAAARGSWTTRRPRRWPG